MNGDQKLVTVLAVCGVAVLAAFINGYVLLVILLTKRVRFTLIKYTRRFNVYDCINMYIA